MENQMDMMNLLPLLNSPDIATVRQIKEVVIEQLNNIREPWLLNAVVDSFMLSKCQACLEILSTIRQPHNKHLFDKLADQMRGSNKLAVLRILGHLVVKEPPWIHGIVHHQLLGIIVRSLKVEKDVPTLMSGVLVITMLLPVVPVLIVPYFSGIFDLFTRLADYCSSKPANVLEVYLVHLRVGLYCLFHRLYGMYPCHFLTYLRDVFTKSANRHIFNETIEPMLHMVRMHPLLITASKEKEISKERWKKLESHDITVECAKLSLDLIEGRSEEDLKCPVRPASLSCSRSHNQQMKGEGWAGKNQADGAVEPVSLVSEVVVSVEPTESTEADNLWSPASVCGLSTPPVDAMDTSDSSFQSRPTSRQGTQVNVSARTTPHTLMMVPDSPLPLQTDQDKAKKRLSAITLSLAGTISTPTEFGGSGSVPPSPLRRDFTSEPPRHAQPMHAIRKLTFQFPPAAVESGVGRDNEEEGIAASTTRKEGTSGQSGMDEQSGLDGQLGMTEQSDLADQPPQTGEDVAAEAVEESDFTQPWDVPRETRATPVEPVDIPAVAGLQGSVAASPSVSQISQFLDTLNAPAEDADTEVSELTGCGYGPEEEDTAGDDAAFPGDQASAASSQETSSSVKAFMKQVNRIRFNSITATSGAALSRDGVAARHFRTSSCPSLDSCDSEDVGDVTQHGDPNNPPDGAPISIELTAIQSAPVVSQSSAADRVPFRKVTSDDSAATTDSYTTASHPTEDFQVTFPYHLLLASLPCAPQLRCYNCLRRDRHGSDSSSTDAAARGRCDKEDSAHKFPPLDRESIYRTLSPPDLLDRHIQLGGQVHASQLSGIPLTSQSSVSWTHFGGVPPTDEVNILRGEILLLHNQLMYERHKRELYAKRNRRSLRRIVKTVSLEEENAAMRDQMRLEENEIQSLRDALKLTQAQKQQLKVTAEGCEYEKEVTQKSHLAEVSSLRDQNFELQTQLKNEQADNLRQKQESQESRSQLFTTLKQLDEMRKQAAAAQELHEQVTHLSNELLLMSELQQKYQQRLVAVSNSHCPKPELHFILDTYKTELKSKQTSLQLQTVQLEALKARASELEESLMNKDNLLTQLNQSLSDTASLYQAQLKATQQKYEALKQVQVCLQADILDLHSQLSLAHAALERPAPSANGAVSVTADSATVDDVDTGPEVVTRQTTSAGSLDRRPTRTDLRTSHSSTIN